MGTEISEKAAHQKMDFSQLAKATGSKKGLDPMPPDQYESRMNARYSPTERLLACVWSKTMGRNHRSPFCVDEQGRDLNIRELALELRMDRKQAERALAHLVAEGFLRMQGYRIHLNGEVQLKAVPPDPKLVSWGTSVPVPPYLLKQIKALPPDTQKRFWDWKRDTEHRSKLVRRELAAALRIREEQEEDTFFSQIGLQKNHQPKRRAAPSPLLPLLDPLVAGILQSQNGHGTPQTQNPGAMEPENLSIQTSSGGASLYTETEIRQREAGAVPSSSSTVAILDEKVAAAAVESTGLERQTTGQTPPPPPLPSPEIQNSKPNTLAVSRAMRTGGFPIDHDLATRLAKHLPPEQVPEFIKFLRWKNGQRAQPIAPGIYPTIAREFLQDFEGRCPAEPPGKRKLSKFEEAMAGAHALEMAERAKKA